MTVKLPELLHYQKDLLTFLETEEVKYVTFLKSRQSGGSYFNKWVVLKWCMEKPGRKVGYITPTYKLSKLFWDELYRVSKPLVVKKSGTELILEFMTGSYVQFFSAESGDSIRGFQFTHLILDEAAYMTDTFYQEVVQATTLIKGEKVMMCSTPSKKGGFFHQHYSRGLEEEGRYRSKKITIYDNPFISPEELQDIKRTVPDKVFRQEYLSEFQDDIGSVFPNLGESVREGEGERTGEYFAGVDWGRDKDFTVCTILNSRGEMMEIMRINMVDYTTQVKWVIRMLEKWRPRMTILEENSIGMVNNSLVQQGYKGNIERHVLTNTSKVELIDNLTVGFEQKKLTILNNPHLLTELSAYTQYYNMKTKNTTFNAPSGFHDDCVMSLGYAYKGLTSRKGSYSISFM